MADECVFMWEMFLQIINGGAGNTYLIFFWEHYWKLKKILGGLMS